MLLGLYLAVCLTQLLCCRHLPHGTGPMTVSEDMPGRRVGVALLFPVAGINAMFKQLAEVKMSVEHCDVTPTVQETLTREGCPKHNPETQSWEVCYKVDLKALKGVNLDFYGSCIGRNMGGLVSVH